MNEEIQFLRAEWQNAVGLAAKQLCSLVYVSGFEPEQAKSIYIDPVLVPFDLDMTIEYDLSQRKVTVSCPGPYAATAEMRAGIGCTVTTKLDKDAKLPEVELPEVQNLDLRNASPKEIEQTFDQQAVEAALDHAFSPSHNTLAVVLLHKGELIAEKYADGIPINNTASRLVDGKKSYSHFRGNSGKEESLIFTNQVWCLSGVKIRMAANGFL